MPSRFRSFAMPQVLPSLGKRASASRLIRWLLAVIVLCVISSAAHAQNGSYLTRIGAPDFSVLDPVKDGFVDLANGNLHIEIPIASIPQRGGLNLSAKLVYDSKIWQHYSFVQNPGWYPYNVGGLLGGWRIVISGQNYTNTCSPRNQTCFGVQEGVDQMLCTGPDGMTGYIDTIYGPFNWSAPDGTSYSFPIQTVEPNSPDFSCWGGAVPTGVYRTSSYSMVVTNYTDAVVYAADGTQLFPGIKDTNGNYFSLDANANAIDTVGRTPVLVSSSANEIYLDVLNSQGGRSRYTVTTGSINASTSFGRVQTNEFSGTITVVQSLTLPNG